MERAVKRNKKGSIVSYEITDSTGSYGVIKLDNNVRLFTSQSFYLNQTTEITELEIDDQEIIGYSFDVIPYIN
jgi:hypothetical protein